MRLSYLLIGLGLKLNLLASSPFQLDCASLPTWRPSKVACEIRELTSPSKTSLRLKSFSGSIHVRGWSEPTIAVRARIEGYSDDTDLTARLQEIQSTFSENTLSASGPSFGGSSWWQVSYEIFTPHGATLQLDSNNGQVKLTDFHGEIRMEVNNGAIQVHNGSGRIEGRTRNGSVDFSTVGEKWIGQGIDLATGNGSITVRKSNSQMGPVRTFEGQPGGRIRLSSGMGNIEFLVR